MHYSQHIFDPIMDKPHPHHMAEDRDRLIGEVGDSHYAGIYWLTTNGWAHARGAAAWRRAGNLNEAHAVQRTIDAQLGPGGIFAEDSTHHPADWLRFFTNNRLEHLKKAVVDCIAMAGCVLGAALITLLLGM